MYLGWNVTSRTVGRERKSRMTNGMIALADLHAAKKLVETLGSIDRAQSVIVALARLQ